MRVVADDLQDVHRQKASKNAPSGAFLLLVQVNGHQSIEVPATKGPVTRFCCVFVQSLGLAIQVL